MICLPHHWAHWLILSVVTLWCIGGMGIGAIPLSRKVAPAVLALCWAAGEDYTCTTGNNMPTGLYWSLDGLAMALVGWAAWPLNEPAARRDVLILAIYPVMWSVYVYETGSAQWWTLWALALAQFILAGPWPAVLRNRTQEFRRGFTGTTPIKKGA